MVQIVRVNKSKGGLNGSTSSKTCSRGDEYPDGNAVFQWQLQGGD
jgi:hypothetical protein